jgi:mRNA interferase RelE/StbE
LKVEFKASFAKDLRKINNASINKQVSQVIEYVEKAHNFPEIVNLKKIVGADNYYRIRIGDYRIGVVIEADTVIFVRVLHRKDIYRYFP